MVCGDGVVVFGGVWRWCSGVWRRERERETEQKHVIHYWYVVVVVVFESVILSNKAKNKGKRTAVSL